MRSRSAIAVALLTAAVVACGSGDGSSDGTVPSFVVSGYAHSGPTCPVIITPPDPTCDDRPVADALLVVFAVSGGEVARIRTGEDGSFSVSLPPGTYELVPQAVEGLMGTPAGLEVIVVDGPITGLDLAYDTGIR